MIPTLINIKNALLRYSLFDTDGDFENLTMREKAIVGNQENFDILIKDIETSTRAMILIHSNPTLNRPILIPKPE
jgi:hypothetical protein